MTQEKQRRRGTVPGTGEGAERPEPDGPHGRLPAGRESFPLRTARRRSEVALASMGLETALDTCARLDGEARSAAAAGKVEAASKLRTESKALRAWANRDPGLVSGVLRSLPTTTGGAGRELRVGMCGVAFVARREDAVGFARRGCKDRLCADCGRRRSRRFAAALRELVAERRGLDVLHELHPSRLLFVTLTQKKRWKEIPKDALDRLLDAFTRFRESSWGRRYLVGGVRSMEVTARRRNARVVDAGSPGGFHEVKIPGIHAHLHCLIEVEDGTLDLPWSALGVGVSASELAAAWCRACPGAAAPAVDVQELTEDNVYQVGSYVLDMSGLLEMLDGDPAYVRLVLAALHGRRLVAAFGAWREYDLGLREDKGSLVYGDRSLYTMATTEPGEAAPVVWGDGRQDEAEDVLRAILQGSRRPV